MPTTQLHLNNNETTITIPNVTNAAYPPGKQQRRTNKAVSPPVTINCSTNVTNKVRKVTTGHSGNGELQNGQATPRERNVTT